MTDARHPWHRLVLSIVLLAIALSNIVRAGPMWWGLIASLLPVVAGAALVAAMAAVIVARRSAGR